MQSPFGASEARWYCRDMIAGLILLGAVLALPAIATAADLGDRPRQVFSGKAGPYPLSWRAAKVRGADRCWRSCLAGAGRTFQTCTQSNGLTDCVRRNADADRSCLRKCRLAGGPLVDVE